MVGFKRIIAFALAIALSQSSAAFHYNNELIDNNAKINLTWSGVNAIEKEGNKVFISLYSKLKDNSKSIYNVKYLLEIKGDDTSSNYENINVIYMGKEIKCEDGVYKIAEEKIQDEDKTYNFFIIFNKPGKYEINIYAESN